MVALDFKWIDEADRDDADDEEEESERSIEEPTVGVSLDVSCVPCPISMAPCLDSKSISSCGHDTVHDSDDVGLDDEVLPDEEPR